MDARTEVITLEIIPIPPDTAESLRREVIPLIYQALRDEGKESLLTDKHLSIEMEQTFPADAQSVVITLLITQVVGPVVTKLVIPLLKQRFLVKQTKKPPLEKNHEGPETRRTSDATVQEPRDKAVGKKKRTGKKHPTEKA